MKVWCIFREYPHQGDELVHIFSDEALAYEKQGELSASGKGRRYVVQEWEVWDGKGQ